MRRHYELEERHEDASFYELDRRACCKTNPTMLPITMDVLLECTSQEELEAIKKADLFIHSSIERTKLTAEAHRTLLELETPLVEDPVLNELRFRPLFMKPLLRDDEMPFQTVVRELYPQAMRVNGLEEYERPEGVDSFEEIYNQIEDILEKYSEMNVICFSHGFLMRVMRAYLLSSNKDIYDVYNKTKMSISPRVGYLEMIYVQK